MADDLPPFYPEIHPAYCPKMMDVVECNTRLALNILILAAAIPLIIAAAIPRRRMPRSMYPSWYNNLWVIRLGLHGVVGAYSAILVVVYTTRVFIYDFSIYAYITCISIKSLHDFHMWDRMKTTRAIGFFFWSCMLLNRIAANGYQGVTVLILQADILFPIIILGFECIPFPCERFLSFQSRGFLDDYDRSSLDNINPAHLRYNPDDEELFLRRVRSGNRKEVLRLLQLAGPTVKVLLNRTITFWGDTALHLAYRRRDTEMVRLLLSYGADPTVLNDSDQPAIPAGDTNMHQLHSTVADSMSFSRLGLNSADADNQPLLAAQKPKSG